MKHPLIAAAALIAMGSVASAQPAATGQNGAQYGDPNNSMAEGSQTTNGALSGSPPGDITSGSSETHSYNGTDFNQNNNGAFSPQSNGELNNGSNISANPPGTR
jgi:hypothetical protein